jgi:hypothetical protein
LRVAVVLDEQPRAVGQPFDVPDRQRPPRRQHRKARPPGKKNESHGQAQAERCSEGRGPGGRQRSQAPWRLLRETEAECHGAREPEQQPQKLGPPAGSDVKGEVRR